MGCWVLSWGRCGWGCAAARAGITRARITFDLCADSTAVGASRRRVGSTVHRTAFGVNISSLLNGVVTCIEPVYPDERPRRSNVNPGTLRCRVALKADAISDECATVHINTRAFRCRVVLKGTVCHHKRARVHVCRGAFCSRVAVLEHTLLYNKGPRHKGGTAVSDRRAVPHREV